MTLTLDTKHIDKGILTTSWNNAQETNVTSDEVLFTLVFNTLQSGTTKDLLDITSAYTSAEAYNASLDVQQVDLEFKNNVDKVSDFTLMQNQPNPFTQATTIGFVLPETTQAVLKVMDVNGKVIKRYEGVYQAGLNQINISKGELNVAGVLYYQLETDRFHATKKMILVE